LFIRILIAGLILIFVSCQAPHDNPFDPNSPAYVPDSAPELIEDLTLDSLVNLQCRFVWTSPEDADDYKLYSGLPDWNGVDPVGAELYTGEIPGVKPAGTLQSIWVNLPPGQSRAWALFSVSEKGLMSKGSNPVVIAAPPRDRQSDIDVSVKSIHHASWTLPYYVLEIEAAINDSDGIDRVWVEFNDLELGILLPEEDSLYCSGSFEDAYLSRFNLEIEDFIGHQLVIYVLDKARFVHTSSPFILIRNISDLPSVISPVDTTLETTQPHLVWNEYESYFDFTYKVEILHIQEGSTEGNSIYLVEDIPSDSTSHQVTTPLTIEPQFLVWTVSVVDEFGNEARSLTNRFWISGNE